MPATRVGRFLEFVPSPLFCKPFSPVRFGTAGESRPPFHRGVVAWNQAARQNDTSKTMSVKQMAAHPVLATAKLLAASILFVFVSIESPPPSALLTPACLSPAPAR